MRLFVIADADIVYEVEDRILTEIIQKVPPTETNVRLLSERKIAEMLSVPQSRVHQAIGRLAKRGFLFTKRGAGTYIDMTAINKREPDSFLDSNHDSFHFPNLASLKAVKLHVHGVPCNKFWYKIINAFTDKYPFVEVEASAINDNSSESVKDAPCDILLHKTYELNLNHKNFLPIDFSIMHECEFNQDDLCSGILDSCKVNDELLGIPVLRNTAITYVNKDIMNRYGISETSINKSFDIFRQGDIIERESGGNIFGVRYMNFIYHSMTEGILLERKNDKYVFDSTKMKHFLETIKPFIKKHHFKIDALLQTEAFIKGDYLFFPDFSSSYPYMQQSKDRLEAIHIPKPSDGISSEWMYLGSISKKTENIFEAHLFLSYLCGRDAQMMFNENAPHWLSVRKDMLDLQRQNSVFPENTVDYDFDIRSYYTQTNSKTWEATFKAHIEVAKYFLTLRSLENTIESLENVFNN